MWHWMARFSLRYKLRATSIQEIESTLDTGDIVLLSGDDITYLTSLGPGTWSGFSRCAFVVRTAPGVKGLLLCHADAQPIPDSDRHEVTLTRLYDELKSGQINFAVVRKLVQPLSIVEKRGVREYANASVGKSLNARANILMADPSEIALMQRLNCFGRGYERFFCSELVAQMLVISGRAYRKKSTLDFLPTEAEGRLLQAPIAMECSPRSLVTSFRRKKTTTLVPVETFARASMSI